MTPSDLEVLIHCHIDPAPHPRTYAPGISSALSWFEAEGLIEHRHGRVYITTQRGAEHIAKLCDMPLPPRDEPTRQEP